MTRRYEKRVAQCAGQLEIAKSCLAQCRRLMKRDVTFKSSACKKVAAMRFFPTNLHLQRMIVHHVLTDAYSEGSASRYVKMRQMHLPDGAIAQRMSFDGVSHSDIFNFFSIVEADEEAKVGAQFSSAAETDEGGSSIGCKEASRGAAAAGEGSQQQAAAASPPRFPPRKSCAH